MLASKAIVDLHDHLTRAWHAPQHSGEPGAIPFPARVGQVESSDLEKAFLAQVARQHRANFDLWHIEDEARTPGTTDAALADVKRRIDTTNQRRNDLAEGLDRALVDWLTTQGLPNPAAALHSESPGLMIDRLSILALKIYHTCEECERPGAAEGHSERNRDRLNILEEQRADLAACLDGLWRETLAGTRRFKLYRQLKMYNDPSLNPAIYRKPAHGAER
ncbi:MAG: DUF4254 domain-containing protein [Terracidiphilus sp.]